MANSNFHQVTDVSVPQKTAGAERLPLEAPFPRAFAGAPSLRFSTRVGRALAFTGDGWPILVLLGKGGVLL